MNLKTTWLISGRTRAEAVRLAEGTFERKLPNNQLAIRVGPMVFMIVADCDPQYPQKLRSGRFDGWLGEGRVSPAFRKLALQRTNLDALIYPGRIEGEPLTHAQVVAKNIRLEQEEEQKRETA